MSIRTSSSGHLSSEWTTADGMFLDFSGEQFYSRFHTLKVYLKCLLRFSGRKDPFYVWIFEHTLIPVFETFGNESREFFRRRAPFVC